MFLISGVSILARVVTTHYGLGIRAEGLSFSVDKTGTHVHAACIGQGSVATLGRWALSSTFHSQAEVTLHTQVLREYIFWSDRRNVSPQNYLNNVYVSLQYLYLSCLNIQIGVRLPLPSETTGPCPPILLPFSSLLSILYSHFLIIVLHRNYCHIIIIVICCIE